MNTTRAQAPWNNGAAPGSKYVFIPGNAKPINAGSIERAAFIVRVANAWYDLAALKARVAELENSK